MGSGVGADTAQVKHVAPPGQTWPAQANVRLEAGAKPGHTGLFLAMLALGVGDGDGDGDGDDDDDDDDDGDSEGDKTPLVQPTQFLSQLGSAEGRKK